MKALSTKRRAYAGLMRALMLFAVALTGALVLFLMTLLINAALNFFLKRSKEK